MNDIQAALGLSQIKKLDQFIKRRCEIARLYNEKLADVPGVTLPKQLADTESGWHLYMIQLNEEIIGKSKRQVFDEMRNANIGVHVHYIPVYWHPYYRELGYEKGLCLVAEEWYKHALTLPIFPNMTEEDIEFVVSVLTNTIS